MKNKIVISIIGILVIVILIIVVFWYLHSNTLFSQNNTLNKEEVFSDEEAPIIDKNNLENAKIIEGEKVNNSKLIKKEHFAIDDDQDGKISELSITNFEIYSDSIKDVSYYKATITNKDTVDFKSNTIIVYFCDESGYCFHTMYYFVKEDIKPGKSIEISGYDIADFINAYDYKVRIMATH